MSCHFGKVLDVVSTLNGTCGVEQVHIIINPSPSMRNHYVNVVFITSNQTVL